MSFSIFATIIECNFMYVFCYQRLAIGVQKQTSNIGVLLEMGIVPIHHYSIKFAVKNWERIKGGCANGMLLSAYAESELMGLSWTSGIKKLLNSIGMNNFFINEYPGEHPFIFKRVGERMSDIFTQNCFEKIGDPSNKLRPYAIFKTDAGFEEYLVQVKNVMERQLVTRFRLSNHRLMVEVGRHRHIKNVGGRTCPFCPGVVEDELHFLFECKAYRIPRRNYINPITNIITGFNTLTRREKFGIVMCKMDKDLCKYISNCMEIRSFLDSKPKRNV